jgi:hypothetical protein
VLLAAASAAGEVVLFDLEEEEGNYPTRLKPRGASRVAGGLVCQREGVLAMLTGREVGRYKLTLYKSRVGSAWS